MKRIASIDKIQKSAQNTLRRFRSWSQGGLSSSEAGGGGGGGYEGGGGGGGQRRSMNSPPPSSITRKSITPNTPGLNPAPTKPRNPNRNNNNNDPVNSTSQQQQQPPPTTTLLNSSEPYLDEDELTPLIYGYLHKLGRNGHWQKRFFETNGERLTYYKSGKRTKALAMLDLCKVRIYIVVVVCMFVLY